MLTSESKRKIVAGCVFGLPIGAVLLVANVMGPSPSASLADDGLVPAIAQPATGGEGTGAIAMTPAARAAIEHIAQLDAEEFGPTPLYNPSRGETIVSDEDPELPPPPNLEIGLIMATSKGNIALIDRQRYRVGDRLADTTWTITEIDAVRRAVTIEDEETGRIRTQLVDGPSVGQKGRIEVNRRDDERGALRESSPAREVEPEPAPAEDADSQASEDT